MKINNNLKQTKHATFGSLSNLSSRTVRHIQNADKISSVGQRLLIGATALVLQPIIDMSNKSVDKKTREQSALRSIARSVVGATTGITVRAAAIKIAEKCYENGKFLNFTVTDKFKDVMPKNCDKMIKTLSDASPKQIKTYIAAMGTILGLCIMLFTNFLIDAPLINVAQNKMDSLYNKLKGNKTKTSDDKTNEEIKNDTSK